MRNFKKFLAVICSMSLMATSAVTAFAEAPTSSAGTGGILSYSLESVVVPTSIKIALNPQGYTITKKEAVTTAVDAEYEDANIDTEAKFRENKAYLFTRTGAGTTDDPYVYTAITGSDEFDKDADPAVTYYKEKTAAIPQAAADTSTDQIVSFNYGIANFSTAPKDIKVHFNVTGEVSTATGKSPITFVDTMKKAQAYNESTNADGAKVDELKMYIAVVAAKEAPKQNLASPVAFAATEMAGGVNKTNVTAKELADVSMTKAENNAGAVAFEADTTNYAVADIAFKLGETKYQVRDYETLDFSTTQTALKDKMEIKTLGDVAGFTFIGAMNPNVDWTTANVTSLSFAPIYTVSKITDTEEAVTGGYKQIKTTPPVVNYTVTYHGNNGTTEDAETETVASGSAPTTAPTYVREGYTQTGWAIAADGEAAALDTFTITANTDLYAIWEEDAVPPTEVTGTYDSTSEHYRINLAAAVSDVSDITNVKVDGVTVAIKELNNGKNIAKIERSAVRTALGGTDNPAWKDATEFEFTFTVDGVNYTCTIGKNG